MTISNTALDVIKTIKRILFSSRLMIVYQCFFEKLVANNLVTFNLKCRELSPCDYKGLEKLLIIQQEEETVFHPTFDIQEAVNRLNHGEYCFICEDNNRIIAYLWYTPGKKYIKEIAATIYPDNAWLYNYNAYVDKRYRGQNIMKYLGLEGGRKLLERGYIGTIGCVMDWNLSMHGTLTKLGYSKVGHVKSGFFLTFQYMRNSCKHISFVTEHGTFDLYHKLVRWILRSGSTS